jgi:hypothetical protein
MALPEVSDCAKCGDTRLRKIVVRDGKWTSVIGSLIPQSKRRTDPWTTNENTQARIHL